MKRGLGKTLSALSLCLMIAVVQTSCDGGGTTVSTPSGNAYHFVTQWGSPGTGNGQFNEALGVAVDSSGNVYVADVRNNRIQKFDSNGNFLTQWAVFVNNGGVAADSSGNVYAIQSGFGNHRVQKFDSNGNFLTQWGPFGTDINAIAPHSVAVDLSGNVYVNYVDRIEKFSPN